MMHTYIRHYRIPQSEYKGQIRGRTYSAFRYFRGEGFLRPHTNEIPASRGGFTICDIWDDGTGEILATGWSHCSYADNFNYKLGRDIAVGRAEKDLAHAQAKEE